MPTAPDHAKSIFLNALEIPAGEARQGYLDRTCGSDASLRAEVEELLDHHAQIPEACDASAVVGTVDMPAEAPVAGKAGTVIGPYRLLQQIGEGGMGTVYMAEQTEPVQRKVALKLIKPGMDSRQVISRFEAERQALALMDHPNIAKVLDAGTTEAGLPYFVMELVKGMPITKYCDEHHLTPRERLELFIPVCQAVQHAHQKGIIHRDLKPSNVLVALYDGRPVPKVIDFGVAKATGQKLTERTMYTEFGAIVGTLEYMSPEQAESNQLDIDTRSDIYSLGVLLYELLTGTTPFEKKRLKDAALMEILRIIREDEPQKPSTRLSTTDELPSISANRGLEPNKLSALVRGELDWIVMKALEKDRNRRYETANGFAMDIQRYLADETVQACPPSAVYRLRKLVRRNKAALTAGTLVVAALVLGTIVSAWQAVQATNARNAERESREAERKAQAALDVAREEKDEQRTRTNRELSDALVEAAGLWEKARIAETGNMDSGNQLRATLGRAATLAASELADPILVARVQTLQENLSQDEKDRRILARLEDIHFEKVARPDGVDHWRTAYEAAFADYGLPISEFLSGAAREEQFEETARRIAASPIRDRLVAALDDCAQSIELCQRLLPIARRVEEKNPWRLQYFDARIRNDVAALLRLGRQPEALTQPPSMIVSVAETLRVTGHDNLSAARLLREAQLLYPADVGIVRRLALVIVFSDGEYRARDELIGLYRTALAARPDDHDRFVHARLATYLKYAGREDEAVAVYRHATGLKSATAADFLNLGGALWLWRKKDRDLDGAIAAFRKAVEVNPKARLAHVELAFALRAKGDSEGAAAAESNAIAVGPPGPYDSVGWAYLGLGIQIQEWNIEESEAAFRKAIELDLSCAETALQNLGSVLARKGDLEGAADAWRKVIQLKPKDHNAHFQLYLILQKQRDGDAAIAALRNAIENNVNLHSVLGDVLWRQKKDLDGAIASFREAAKLDPFDTESRDRLASVLLEKGHVDEAIAVYRELCGIRPDVATYSCKLGSALRQKGDLEGAIAVLRKAIESNPKSGEAHSELAESLLARDDWDATIAACGTAIELDPKWNVARKILAQALSAKGDYDGAIAAYQKAVEMVSPLASAGIDPATGHAFFRVPDSPNVLYLAPAHHIVLNDFAWLLATCPKLKYRDSSRSVELAKKATEMAPNIGALWNTLGAAQYRAGDWQAAVAAFNKSMELRNGGDAYDWFFLAIAHWRLGERDEARKRYDQAVQWTEKNSPALTKQPTLAEELRRFRTEAEEVLELKK